MYCCTSTEQCTKCPDFCNEVGCMNWKECKDFKEGELKKLECAVCKRELPLFKNHMEKITYIRGVDKRDNHQYVFCDACFEKTLQTHEWVNE